ncbi:MAG: 50S ribosomal protein L25 [bacterium]
MSSLTLVANLRQMDEKSADLRKAGLVPAVVYGSGLTTRRLAVKYLDLEKAYKLAGESSLIDLKIGPAESVKVLFKEAQIDPVSGRYLHVDFHQIKMDEKLKAEIPLKFVGEAEAVKNLGGVLETSLQAVEVECLPKDLVHEIEVDLSPLKTFDDIIHIKDLKVPAGLTILNKPDEAVALMVEPAKEEAKPAAETPIGEIPVVGEEKEKETAEQKTEKKE